MTVLLETNFPNLFSRGKVRDTYDLGQELLMIATDRLSAFDVVLPDGIPDKGKVLTRLSAFWFDKTSHLAPNHMVELVEDVRLLHAPAYRESCFAFPAYLEGRSLIVRRAKTIPVECVARGYLSGSAWAEYREKGKVSGIALPAGLRESDRLPEPIFTPTTKAASGHDLPLTWDETVTRFGENLARRLRDLTLAIYEFARDYALPRGLIIADTKLEFGFVEGTLTVIDELLTPDSSRFWDAALYEPGRPQPSYDKQPVRDWLTASGWNKEPPAPGLPPEVVGQTADRYREAHRRLTGREL